MEKKHEHDGLVFRIARRYGWALQEGLEFEDLVQAGRIGVLRAKETFDPSRGIAFSTYAQWWIRAGMTKEARRNGRSLRLPSYVYDDRKNNPLPPRCGRLDAPIGEGDATFLDFMESGEESPEAAAEREDTAMRVRDAMQKLPAVHRHVIREYFWKERTYHDIGESVPSRKAGSAKRPRSISRERVRQLINQGLVMLRTELERRQAEDDSL